MEVTRPLLSRLILQFPRPLQTQSSKRLFSQRPSPSRLLHLKYPRQLLSTTSIRHNISSSSPTIPPELPSFFPQEKLAEPPSSLSTDSLESSTSNLESSPEPPASFQSERIREETPAYELTFTCKPCKHRSSHRVSKQGYHKGSVLITCPACKNRHVISDHLRIFSDNGMTIEELLGKRGELVKKGTLGADGDIEFWDDGTTTPRLDKSQEKEGKEEGEAEVQRKEGQERLESSPVS